jgi:hypothetical protein
MTRPEFDTQRNPRPWERIDLSKWEHVDGSRDHPADPHYVGTEMFRCHECNGKVKVRV